MEIHHTLNIYKHIATHISAHIITMPYRILLRYVIYSMRALFLSLLYISMVRILPSALLAILLLPLYATNTPPSPSAPSHSTIPPSLLHSPSTPSPNKAKPPLLLPLPSQLESSPSHSIPEIDDELAIINTTLEHSNNPWLKRYADYANYNRITRQMQTLQNEILHSKPNDLSALNEKRLAIETLERQLELLHDAKTNPFKDLIQKPEIGDLPSITNPFAIISGISFLHTLQSNKSAFESNKESLEIVLELIGRKYALLEKLRKIRTSPNIEQELALTQAELLEFQSAANIIATSIEIYTKRYDEAHALISQQIRQQSIKLAYIALAILISIGLALGLKLLGRRYITHSERIYTANKIINFFNITVIVLILLFAYLENVTYLVTVLGFASAGLAIAMKDLFMSILGWFVIVLGGSIHVGDRVRVEKDGSVYVGDVLDISMLRITIYEDVTLTSFLQNRRAGRIIFIPNNVVFTTMLANYTHHGMQTVWDGIDICVTFDSNHQKAMHIALEIALKHARSYTIITKKKLRKMRDRYSLRHNNVEPRIYSFIVQQGIMISVWYQTDAYATLHTRSMMSLEITQAFLQEPDIFIAYETTKFVQTPYDGFGNKPYTHSPSYPKDSHEQIT